MNPGSSPSDHPPPPDSADDSAWADPDAPAAASSPRPVDEQPRVPAPRAPQTQPQPPEIPIPRQPYPSGLTPSAPGQPPRRRKLLLTVYCVVLTLLAGMTLVGTAALVRSESAPLGSGAVVSPEPDDNPSVRQTYLLHKAKVALQDSAQGLLDNDESDWLEVFDPALHDDMKRRFDSLRALEVSSFDYQVLSEAPKAQKRDNTYELELAATYCFGGKKNEKCSTTGVLFKTEWVDKNDKFVINHVDESYKDERGPRPWEVENLRAKSGDKAIVAAPADEADKLDSALDLAEEAAQNADKYAKFGEVEKYVVFLAGDDEFSRWYGQDNPGSNVVGLAISLPTVNGDGETKTGGSEVVMHVDRLSDPKEFEATMRHELGHVATLHHSPKHHQREEEWWVSEGLAELIDHGPDADLDDYLRGSDVKRYLKNDDWDGELTPPSGDDDALSGSAKYGLAFYGAYYLWHEHGGKDFMEFFSQVAREGADPEVAAEKVYGMSYSELETDVEEFIKQTA